MSTSDTRCLVSVRLASSVWAITLLVLVYCFYIGSLTIKTISFRDYLSDLNILYTRLSTSNNEFRNLPAVATANKAPGESAEPASKTQDYPGAQSKRDTLIFQIQADYDRKKSIYLDFCRIFNSLFYKVTALLEIEQFSLESQCSLYKNFLAGADNNANGDVTLVEFQLKKQAEEVYTYYSNFILPFLYGVLGAIVQLYAKSAKTAESNGGTAQDPDFSSLSKSLALGGLAGMVIGWFLQPASSIPAQTVTETSQIFRQPQLSLFPFAVAFLVGMKVNIFFDVIDRLEMVVLGNKPQTDNNNGSAEAGQSKNLDQSDSGPTKKPDPDKNIPEDRFDKDSKPKDRLE
jgi:hypothetical protein